MTTLRCSKVGEILSSKVHTHLFSCINFSKMHQHCHYESKVPRHPHYLSSLIKNGIYYFLRWATHFEASLKLKHNNSLKPYLI